jgi:hypothetical protein
MDVVRGSWIGIQFHGDGLVGCFWIGRELGLVMIPGFLVWDGHTVLYVYCSSLHSAAASSCSFCVAS